MNQTFDLLNSELNDGITLIDSSAGTGKTFTIASLVPRLLLEEKISDISKLLVVTFTNAAADELADRIRNRLLETSEAFDNPEQADEFLRQLVLSHNPSKRSIITKAINFIDEAGIFTIHGFCKKMLEDAAFESAMPLEYEFIKNETTLLRSSAMDFWRKNIYPDPVLAGYTISFNILPDTLISDYKNYRTHSGCLLLPDAPALEISLNLAQENLHKIRNHWQQEDFINYLKSLPQLSTGKVNEELVNTLGNPEALAQRINNALASDNLTAMLKVCKIILPDTIIGVIRNKAEREAHVAHPFSELAQQLLNSSEMILHSLRKEFFKEMDIVLSESKQRDNIISFQDLLTLLHQALNDQANGANLARTISNNYQVALIDEFQDTDPLQLDIFRKIFAGRRALFFIGDPKQAIYSFRGADIFAYIQAAQIAQNHYTLEKNWRSSQEMVEATNYLFNLQNNLFVFQEITFNPATAARKNKLLDDPLAKVCHWLPLNYATADKPLNKGEAEIAATRVCSEEISRLLNSNAHIEQQTVKPGDIAVLVRSNAQAMLIQQELNRLEIPSVIGSNDSILKSPEFRETELVLQFITHGQSTAALCGTIWNYSAAQLNDLLSDEARWQEIIDQCRRYRELWKTSGITTMLQTLLREHAVAARVLAQPGGKRKLTNYRHVMEIVNSGPTSPESLLQWLERRAKTEEDEEDELRLDTDAMAVQIVTIHKSKGLEYNIVFCPFLWKSRKATKRKSVLAHLNNKTYLDFGSEHFAELQKQAQAEDLSEDLRLLYVAITRAAERVYIAWDKIKDCEESALGWLLSSKPGLAQVIESAPELMSSGIIPQAKEQPGTQASSAEIISQCRTFSRRTKLNSWHTTSFSGLTRNHAHSAPPEKQMPSQTDNAMRFFARGKAAPPANETGTCLHEILENCDLSSEQDNDVIRQSLMRFGLLTPAAHLSEEDPVTTVSKLLETIAECPLPQSEFSLNGVSRHLKEMPFTLPLAPHYFPDAITEIFSQNDPYRKNLLSLNRLTAEGYLTGIIDDVFCHNDKWYIIDWKSNFLGLSDEDYAPAQLMNSMRENHYILQYLLYTVALKRHLTLRLGTFNYAENFGGVYYCFLRGVNKSGKGWFYDRPSAILISALENALFSEQNST